jgi:hypothetical protein
MYTFAGCIITNFLAFQLVINYPCTQEEIYGNYTQYLIKDALFWQEESDPEWYKENPSVHTPLTETKIDGFPGLVRACPKIFISRTDRLCREFSARNGEETTAAEHYLYYGGCPRIEIPLRPLVCEFMNTAVFKYADP